MSGWVDEFNEGWVVVVWLWLWCGNGSVAVADVLWLWCGNGIVGCGCGDVLVAVGVLQPS